MARIPDENEMVALLQETDWLKRLARGLVRSEADADDLVQATVFEALKRDGGDVESSRPFLATLMRRLSLKNYRSDERRLKREQTHAQLRSGTDPISSLERVEAQERLIGCLRRLPDLEREVLVMRYFDEVPARKIASQLDLPLETVKSRLKRGLVKLRKDLGRELGGDYRLALLPILAAGLSQKSAVAASTWVIGKGAAIMSTGTKISLAGAAVIVLAISVYFLRDFGDASETVFEDRRQEETAELEPQLFAREPGTQPELVLPDRAEKRELDPTREIQRVDSVETSITVRGRVVDQFGIPVEAALVHLAGLGNRGVSDFDDAVFRLQLHYSGRESFTEPKTLTDAAGQFSLTHKSNADQVTVVAGHETKGVVLRRGVVLGESAAAEMELKLSGGVLVCGRVVDEMGLPIAGVKVSLSGSRNGDHSGHGMVLTAADGHYRSIAMPYQTFSARAEAPGFKAAFQHLKEEVVGHECRFDFILQRETQSTGSLILADGRLAALTKLVVEKFGRREANSWFNDFPLRVCLSWTSPEDDIQSRMIHESDTETDILASQYRLNGHRPGKIVYLLAGRTILGRTTIGPEGGAPDIIVDPALLPDPLIRSDISITVTNEKGEPLPAFSLEAGPLHDDRDVRSDHQWRTLCSSPEGNFNAKGLAAGTWLLVVGAPGYAEMRQVIKLGPEPVALKFQMVPAEAKISGLVMNEVGQPLNAVSLRCLSANSEGEYTIPISSAHSRSNEDGRFAMSGLPPKRFLLMIAAEGFAATSQIIDLSSDVPDLKLHLQKACRVHFDIQDTSSACVFTILDSQNLPIHEDASRGLECLGGRSLDLPRGRLKARVRSRSLGVIEFEFDSRDGAEIPVRFGN